MNHNNLPSARWNLAEELKISLLMSKKRNCTVKALMSTCLSQGLKNMSCVLVTPKSKVCCDIGCFWLKLEPATPNMLQQGGQMRATSCAQQCCTMLRWNVVIIWSGLKICDWLMVTKGVEPLIESFRHKLLLGSLCCVPFQNTLLSQYFFLPRNIKRFLK